MSTFSHYSGFPQPTKPQSFKLTYFFLIREPQFKLLLPGPAASVRRKNRHPKETPTVCSVDLQPPPNPPPNSLWPLALPTFVFKVTTGLLTHQALPSFHGHSSGFLWSIGEELL